MRNVVHRLTQAASSAALLLAVGCSSSTGPGSNGSAPMSASVDGAAWSASSTSATFNNGILAMAGVNPQSGTIALGVIASAPGTSAIGLALPGNASFTNGGTSWEAAISGGSGSITITSLTTTEAKGTFQITAAPVTGTGATGSKVVTQGTFDVTF